MFKNKITKLTSGAAMLGVAPTLALQAQGGMDAASKEAVESFLNQKFFKILGWSIFAVVGVVGLILLIKYFSSNEESDNSGIVKGDDSFKNEYDEIDMVGNDLLNHEKNKGNKVKIKVIKNIESMTLEEAEEAFELKKKEYIDANSEVNQLDNRINDYEKWIKQIEENTKAFDNIKKIKKGLESKEVKNDILVMRFNSCENRIKEIEADMRINSGNIEGEKKAMDASYVKGEIKSQADTVRTKERILEFLKNKDNASYAEDYNESLELLDKICLQDHVIDENDKTEVEKMEGKLCDLNDKLFIKKKRRPFEPAERLMCSVKKMIGDMLKAPSLIEQLEKEKSKLEKSIGTLRKERDELEKELKTNKIDIKKKLDLEAFSKKNEEMSESFSKIKDNKFLIDNGIGKHSPLDDYFKACDSLLEKNSTDNVEKVISGYNNSIKFFENKKIETLDNELIKSFPTKKSVKDMEKEISKDKTKCNAAINRRMELGKERRNLENKVKALKAEKAKMDAAKKAKMDADNVVNKGN